MGLPECSGDYYDWLAKKMGNREPWKTWARTFSISAHHFHNNPVSGCSDCEANVSVTGV